MILNVIGISNDRLSIKRLALGDLILASTIFEESRGIVTDSCHGKLTANVMFGKAGVGKSTLASMVATVPGLFEVGTAGSGTTTLGTWLSSSINQMDYCSFAEETFQPLNEINLPPLPDFDHCNETSENFAFLDTEGLDHQTELGQNYDVVSVLPHTIASENVFLVVRDRLNPAEGQFRNSVI